MNNKYEEALKKAREWYNVPDASELDKELLSNIFPELQESEDNRIRKCIIDSKENGIVSTTEEGLLYYLLKEMPNITLEIKCNNKMEEGLKRLYDMQKKEEHPPLIKIDDNLYKQPKFSVGDVIKLKNCTTCYKVLEVYTDGSLFLDDNQTIPPSDVHNYELATDEIVNNGKAEEYSFNIDSELFQQLTLEQQKLWKKEIENAYKAGAKWQKQLIEKEKLSEKDFYIDLENELDAYIKNNFTIDKEQLDKFGIEEKDYMYSMDKSDMLMLIKHFASLQRQQDEIVDKMLDKNYAVGYENGKYELLKEAINGEIFEAHEPDNGDTYLDICMPIPKEYKVGDKVKVILIKDE